MSVIQILSDVEAKKIAAGEVVERPASVVKELVENSVDAGATRIFLYLEKSGRQLIRVVDNGFGMVPEDAKACFENHATSKVRSLDDLKKLDTFGFRGEALASISSVSKVVLETRHNAKNYEEETGVRIEYVDGRVVREEIVACPLGTDLQIRDIFYNTPVRQKFLKQDETEWNQIQNFCHAFCLSHRDIHFQLYRDGRLMLNAPPVSGMKDRVMQIWGHNFGQNVTEIAQENNKTGASISGLISRHNFWRYGRQQIFFFVNGRWVKNSELGKALMKGYRSALPPARFPAAFLFITIDRSLVDINVHPRKEEVRFANPVTVANLVQQNVTKTLEGLVSQQLGPVLEENRFSLTTSSPMTPEPIMPMPTTLTRAISLPSKAAEPYVAPVFKQVVVQETVAPKPYVQTGKIIGQLLNMYIVVENKEGLLLIDQHAAHERILYEKYLKNFEHKDGTRLLFPEVIRLNESHRKLILEQQDFLKQQGIEVEQIGTEELVIKTSPPKLQSNSLRALVFEMIEFVEQNEHLDHETFRKKLNEHVHAQMACKMAVKAGDVLSQTMMHSIVSQLQEVDNRFICVHGRPTTWSMSKLDLEKTFRRK
ncbi:DNA mismatch repair endonuclease MutL [Candidatus Dependentiae bacterium]|nr:DNA mismatch repair endonuclease MutL [Candidatus Dependentiae bacterium]